MAISQTKASRSGKKLTQSYATISIIEFLTDLEKLRVQLVCKKWHTYFVPMTLRTCVTFFTVKPTQYYQFVYEHEGVHFFMGTKLDRPSDLREGLEFPSKYLSAGTTDDYKSLKWRHDGNGRIE